MKKLPVFILLLSLFGLQSTFAGGNKGAATEEIHWMTIEQAEAAMKNEPKFVLMDVYTTWCGWCKVMDKKTYTNPEVIKYVNKNFYPVKFDAEQKGTIHFMGKDWSFDSKYRANTLAAELLNGRLSYPTTVIMGKDFKGVNPIPGYLEVPQMESILRFFGDNIYLHQDWTDYQKAFKSTWQ